MGMLQVDWALHWRVMSQLLNAEKPGSRDCRWSFSTVRRSGGRIITEMVQIHILPSKYLRKWVHVRYNQYQESHAGAFG